MRKTPREVFDDIYTNRNHSWAKEIENRNSNKLDKVALKFRGLEVTYGELIHNYKDIWSPALKACGINKGDRVLLSISSSPEYVYLLGAVSTVAAQFNIVSGEFDNDYLFDLMCESKFDYIFVGEDRINDMYDALVRLNKETTKKIVIVPLDYSLPNGNPYSDITDKFETYDKDEMVKNINSLSNTISLNEFLSKGKDYQGEVEEDSSIDDPFTITFSSGTTDGNKPKGIVHRVKHYITMGRYHDKDVSGLPNLKDSLTYSTIPTHSNSYLASVVSDTLMEGATIALDPIVNNDYMLFGLQINQPTMAISTTSTWIKAAKIYNSLDGKSKEKMKFRNLLLPVAVGEALSPGEEKFLNKFIVATKCGVRFTKLPIIISRMSTCGGCCELGSLFTRAFRVYSKTKQDNKLNEPIGFNTYDFVDVKVLREDGTHCEPYECGKLVAKSECTMIGYDNEPERTKNFFIKDACGNVYGDLGCDGYKDKNGCIYIKGRMLEDKTLVPEYKVSDIILLDTKNIMSVSTVYINDTYVAYIEKQPDCTLSNDKILKMIAERCNSILGYKISSNINVFFMENGMEFPLTGCLKRNIGALRNSNILSETISLDNYLTKTDPSAVKTLIKK